MFQTALGKAPKRYAAIAGRNLRKKVTIRKEIYFINCDILRVYE